MWSNPPVVAHQLREHALARVTEWRVAEIVGEDHGFRQFFVEPQCTRDRSRDLRTLQGVGQAVSIVIAFVIDEDLGLVLQSTKRRRVNDAVAVALVGGPVGGLGLFDDAPARLGALGRVRREALAFFGFESLAIAKRAHASVFSLGFGLFEYALEFCAGSGVDFRTGRLRGHGRRPARDEQIEGSGCDRESEGQCEKARHARGLFSDPVDPVK